MSLRVDERIEPGRIERVYREEAARGSRTQAVPEAAYEMPSDALEVLAALRTLSPKQRAAIVLHHYAGYPVREVAAIVGSTPAAVRVHLSVGRRRLRTWMEDDHG